MIQDNEAIFGKFYPNTYRIIEREYCCGDVKFFVEIKSHHSIQPETITKVTTYGVAFDSLQEASDYINDELIPAEAKLIKLDKYHDVPRSKN